MRDDPNVCPQCGMYPNVCTCYDDIPDYEPEYCSHCGKELEEFSDLGCEYCDSRHPGFGAKP